ncbi:MAG: undecaprenyl-phosphate glucose phosphotransferase [Pseudomonadota bacterium]|nr:undecaprenyl-phosphate glucose phosphotransferase [Pseudomonadota bacterium]
MANVTTRDASSGQRSAPRSRIVNYKGIERRDWGNRPRLGDFRFSEKRSLISPAVVSGIIRLLEFLLVVVTGYAIFHFYVGPSNFPDNPGYVLYVGAIGIASLTTSLAFQLFNLYDLTAVASVGRQVARLGMAWASVFVLLVAAAFFMKVGAEFSRVWLAAWFGCGFAAIMAFRIATAFVIRNWARDGRLDRRAVIVGGGPAGESLIKALEASVESDIRICGVFDDRGDERVSRRVAGYPKLGKVDELLDFCRKTRIDMLIVSLPITAEKRLLTLLKKLWVLPVDIRLSAHSNSLRFRPRAYSYLGNVPCIDVYDKPIADWDHVAKWVFDKVIAVLALIALAPVMLLVAMAVKLDSPGPVLFRQNRYGFNNEIIGVFKFRSMYADKTDHNAGKLVSKGDPRVTRVGRVIRKTSLDELPQLFNVLTGELSLVGPRPHATHAKAANALYNDVVDGYFARHRVKPGITGWAQVNGWRGETDTPEKIQRRVEHDLYYAENWSVLFDLYILAKTPFVLLKTENAY